MRRGQRAISLVLLLSYGALQGCSYKVTQPIPADPAETTDHAIEISKPVLISGYTTAADVHHDWRGRVTECGPDSLCFEAKLISRPGVAPGERFTMAKSDLASITIPKMHLWRSVFVGLVGLSALAFISLIVAVGYHSDF